ncbi:MAG: hypothetical protein MJZ00_05190 [Paludibacteraceae bacterium]|nr:hypothetical protein [Paludibacteraceae bacterium]
MAKFMLLLGLILFALSSSLKEDKKQETPLVPHSSNKKIELNADNWLIRSEQMAKIRYEVTPKIGESCKLDY